MYCFLVCVGLWFFLLFSIKYSYLCCKDANMAAAFEEIHGLLLVTSLKCDKGQHQSVGEHYIT